MGEEKERAIQIPRTEKYKQKGKSYQVGQRRILLFIPSATAMKRGVGGKWAAGVGEKWAAGWGKMGCGWVKNGG